MTRAEELDTSANVPPPSPPGDGSDDAANDAVLLDFLRDRDVPCPLCQYNLRGLLTPRCPECGRDLQLTVGLSEPPLKAWIVAAAAVWIPAGIGILFLLIIAREGFPPTRFALPLLYWIACIPAAAALVRWRRAFMGMSADNQRRAAAAAVTLTVLSLLCVAVMM